MPYSFRSGEELLALCRDHNIPIHEVMFRRELEIGDLPRNALREEMYQNLLVMRASVEKGLAEEYRSVSGLSGGDAQKLDDYADAAFMGPFMAHAVAASMAVVEAVSYTHLGKARFP